MSGYTTGHEERDEGYLKLGQAGYEDRPLLRSALSTRLFVSEGENRFAPGHRHIAEYLAARHLAALIAGGLPPKRVISLMTGVDGVVVTELRGLSAWLAALSPSARRSLIDDDPIGVCLYGDIHDFTPREKAGAPDLPEEESNFTLCKPASGCREEPHVHRYGPCDPGSTGGCDSYQRNIKRSPSSCWMPSVKACPLRSSLMRCSVSYLTAKEALVLSSMLFERSCTTVKLRRYARRRLTELLARIRSGSLLDPDRALQDIALTELYPDVLQPSEIWDHLPDIGRLGSPMPYLGFWRRQLTEGLSPEQVGVLIEGLIRTDADHPGCHGKAASE